MSAIFEEFTVEPVLPTALGAQEWLPLPASDFSFYPAVNSYTLPKPLDFSRLKSALSKTLQLYPAHAGTIARHPESGTWQIRLLNQPVRLVVGRTNEPGPFGPTWTGERHPYYYEELPRGNVTQTAVGNIPLFQAKVTTWDETGQTTIMVSQSYCLGDGFAVLYFMHCWSNLYQGKQPPLIPTFEKYFLPPSHVPPSATHASDLEHISWMAADFTEEYHKNRLHQMENDTERLDATVSGDFVDRVWNTTKRSADSARVSRSDAFAAYLVSVLQSILDEPVNYAHQLVALRGRKMKINGQDLCLPKTTTGNAYMIWGFPIKQSSECMPGSIATAMYKSRQELSDADKLGRIYTLYNSFYEKAIYRNRFFVDGGYSNAIAINWLVNLGLTDAHFGFPLQSGHIEWESLENFIQVWKANPVRQADGTWRSDPEGLQILLRLKTRYVDEFRMRLEADHAALGVRLHPNERANL